jgi:hypothetical protein
LVVVVVSEPAPIELEPEDVLGEADVADEELDVSVLAAGVEVVDDVVPEAPMLCVVLEPPAATPLEFDVPALEPVLAPAFEPVPAPALEPVADVPVLPLPVAPLPALPLPCANAKPSAPVREAAMTVVASLRYVAFMR